MNRKFSISGRIKSMQYAFSGLTVLLIEEHNARVHFFSTIVVLVFAALLGASSVDWLILILVISIVWITEALNTSVENLCDLITTEYDPRVKKIKDIAAAAVFIASVCAVSCGLIVFIPLIF